MTVRPVRLWPVARVRTVALGRGHAGKTVIIDVADTHRVIA
jgi:hypothetical protein